MIGNIFISSALVVVVIFSTGALFKSLSDIKEAKEIQEHYEIVKDIKTLLAKQYNKNIEEITRDDIIANLPQGENWEKVLLLDRNKSSKLSNQDKEFINKDANIEISEDEKLKLLALRAKLKDTININDSNLENKKYKITIGTNAQNIISQDKDFEDRLNKAINYLASEILYSNKDITDTLEKVFNDINPDKNENKEGFFNYKNIYLEDTDEKKKLYIKEKLKQRLEQNQNSIETRLYGELKKQL
ncbi:MAG: hypothetical protein RBS32_01315 [Aliarcobacter sp.]|jgi:hypothetical protein|nr:hypothetical protein [Aliarcobacter sp.]